MSLLPTFSKIYEKTICCHITSFLESNSALFEMQYGFRKARSCEQTLLKAQDTILSGVSRKQISLLLMVDFSKAFNMVDHQIILHKLSNYGILGNALSWLNSYLSNRQQQVFIKGKFSTSRMLEFDVPQAQVSILGPLSHCCLSYT